MQFVRHRKPFNSYALIIFRNMKMRVRAGCTDRYVMKILLHCCRAVVAEKKKTQKNQPKNRWCLLRFSDLEQVNNKKPKSPAGTFWATWHKHADVFLHLQNEPPLFSQDGHKFFFTRAIPQGGRGKFFHISMSTSLVSNCRNILKLFVLTFLVRCVKCLILF